MPSLRSGTVFESPPSNKCAKPDEHTCPICLDVVDCASEVKLVCGHKLHGQCAVRALQLDRRCPVCRKQPRAEGGDDDEAYEERMQEAEDIVYSRLMKRAKVASMKMFLSDCDVPCSVQASATKEDLAEMTAEQLLNETDDDDNDDE